MKDFGPFKTKSTQGIQNFMSKKQCLYKNSSNSIEDYASLKRFILRELIGNSIPT